MKIKTCNAADVVCRSGSATRKLLWPRKDLMKDIFIDNEQLNIGFS